MMKILIACATVAAIIQISGCTKPESLRPVVSEEEVAKERLYQQKLAKRTVFERQNRLSRVAYPIWTNSTDLCGDDTKYLPWAQFLDADNVSDGPFREALIEVLELTPGVHVAFSVTEGGPAYRAGLRIGDHLLNIDGVPLSELKRESVWNGFTHETTAPDPSGVILEKLNHPDGPKVVRIEVERNGERKKLLLEPELSCSYGVYYNPSSAMNAIADGENVVVFSGMLRFVESDDELATILSHELAHNAQRHIQAQEANAGLGSILDILVAATTGVDTQGAFSKSGASAYSKEFEAEADYVGVYAMARGGFDIERAPYVWRRLASEDISSTQSGYGATHPSSAERFLSIDRTVTEIYGKKARSQPLIPNYIPKRRQNRQDEYFPPF